MTDFQEQKEFRERLVVYTSDDNDLHYYGTYTVAFSNYLGQNGSVCIYPNPYNEPSEDLLGNKKPVAIIKESVFKYAQRQIKVNGRWINSSDVNPTTNEFHIDNVEIQRFDAVHNASQGSKIHLFAVLGKTVIGNITIKAPIESSAWLTDIAVHKDYLRKGIGTKLLKEAEKLCLQYGAESMSAQVYKTNKRSLAFNRASGFRIVTDYDDSYKISKFIGVMKMLDFSAKSEDAGSEKRDVDCVEIEPEIQERCYSYSCNSSE